MTDQLKTQIQAIIDNTTNNLVIHFIGNAGAQQAIHQAMSMVGEQIKTVVADAIPEVNVPNQLVLSHIEYLKSCIADLNERIKETAVSDQRYVWARQLSQVHSELSELVGRFIPRQNRFSPIQPVGMMPPPQSNFFNNNPFGMGQNNAQWGGGGFNGNSHFNPRAYPSQYQQHPSGAPADAPKSEQKPSGL